ncbi:MAG: hypothetical protein KAI24_13175 [Planctomycetes bacterium]|nr:hypothetical protein [Planctomycetota bacterium]
MKTLYRCYFPIPCDHDGADSMRDAARAIVEWSERDVDEDAFATLERQEFRSRGRPASSEARLVTDQAGRGWAYRFETADAVDDDVTWITEIGLTEAGDRCLFALGLYLADRSGSLRPLQRDATRPRIVPELLRSFPCPEGLRAEAKILTQDDGDVTAFLEHLRDGARQHPVVLVSVDNFHQKPAADAERLADRLAGLAHVYEMQDKFAGWKLNNRLGKGATPMDGAVRVFWPGWRVHHSPYQHPIYPRHRIVELRRREQGFAGYLLDLLARHTSHAAPREYASWASIVARHQRQRIEEARGAGKTDELVELLDADNRRFAEVNARLEETVKTLEGELLKTKERLEQEERQSSQWRQAYENLRLGKVVSDEDLPEAPPETLKEACQRIERDYGERITFALNKKSDGDYRYEFPDQVLDALGWLVGPYYQWRLGERAGLTFKDLDVELRSICGWHYKPDQSDTTAGKYRDWY